MLAPFMLRPTRQTNRSNRVQWVYGNGAIWVPLDARAQTQIEQLWSTNLSYWVQSDDRNFRGPIYVDIANMCLVHNGIAYTIARCTQ
jgi:hypothetical protein